MSPLPAPSYSIDGTLLVTGGAGGAAWQRAFDELHGVEANVAEHTDAGMTDPEIAAIIFREVIGREGNAEERAKAIGAYLKHLPETVAESSGYRVMPESKSCSTTWNRMKLKANSGPRGAGRGEAG